MDYKEVRLDTVREILLKVYGVYSTVCARDSFTPLDTNAPNAEAIRVLVYLDREIRKTQDGSQFSPEKQYFYSNALGMIWLFCADAEYTYVLGPAFTDNYSMLDVLDKLDSRSLSAGLKSELTEFMKQIPIISSHRMQQYGMMLFCSLHGNTPTIQQMETLKEHGRTSVYKAVDTTIASNYALEQKLWKAVREGNLNYQKDLEVAIANTTPGNISGGHYLRQDKNIAIVQVALACRSAMEGGLSPEIAYPISDRYIQRIEACNSISEVSEISIGVLEDYILRVHQAKLRAGMSHPICECCDYISMHPEENPDIHQMAQKYGYTAYYFSKKFKQEVGMSLRDFAVKEKVERAKMLLTQSTMSVSDISEALGFNSQSYFGSVFRKLTGMTPSEFQRIHTDSQEVKS